MQNNITAGASSRLLENHFSAKRAFNLLLLGYGGGTHDGARLTDSMMVVHIDPKEKTVLLLSIPRDTWVKIPTNGTDGGYWKINAAYEIGINDKDYPNKQHAFKGQTGGGNLAKYVVEEVTGLPIDRFIALDFAGFVRTIDAIGGVDIDVEKTFDDNEYPIEGKENDLCGHDASELPTLEKIATQSATEAFPCRYDHIHFQKGIQHMSGATALQYVRSRHSLQDGTDFGRSKRQRNLLVAVKQKIFSMNFIPNVFSFITSLQDDVRTDMTVDDIKSLVSHASQLNIYTIKSLALTNQNYLIDTISDDGQYIAVPKDGKDNFASIHNWLASYINPGQILTSPVIQIENGTHVAGLAELASNRLRDKDFNVLQPQTSEYQSLERTTIIVYNKKIDARIIQDLEEEFAVKSTGKKISDEVPYDILVILGNDYNLKQGKKLIN